MAPGPPLHEVRPFRVDVRPDRDRAVVIPAGELDMWTTPTLRAEVQELVGRGPAQIVVDLRELAFMDSTGLRLLLELRDELGEGRLGLIDGSPNVRRIIDLTGVRELLPFVG